MTITDEMVLKAVKGYGEYVSEIGMRAALEAVAPMLIAQGMREAAGICGGWGDGGDAASVAILRRAQELDPK